MKRILVCALLILMPLGCATTKTAQEGLPPDPKRDAMKVLAQDIREGLELLDKENDVAASEAFIKAFRQLRSLDAEDRALMDGASDNLKKIAEISGFEYAKKESFALLFLYMDMQRAYADKDSASLKTMALAFNNAYQDVQQKTASEKQKHLEELGTEITARRDEIQKGSEPALLETYPAVYVVKKGDTLPSIAARREIYNDSFMWPLIYKANRDQIKDPKVLYSGQDLKVPREMTSDEIVEARREAGAPEPEKIPKDAYLPKGKKK